MIVVMPIALQSASSPEGVALLTGAAGAGLLAARVALTRTPTVTRSRSHDLTWAVVGLSGVAAALAPGAPTELLVVDVVLKAVLGAAVALFASRARRNALLLAAGIGGLGAHTSWWGLAAFALIGVALATTFSSRARWGTVAGSLWGLALAQVLLRMWWPEPIGATAGLAVAAVAVLAVSWYPLARRRQRRRVLVAVAAAAVAAAVVSVAAAVALLGARGDLERGVDAAERGLAAARAGELQQAAVDMDVAAVALAASHERAMSLWVQPARAIPIAGRYLADLQALSAAATTAAGDGAAVARSSSELRIRDGVVDLAALSELTTALGAAQGSFVAAAVVVARPVSGRWLPGSAQDRLARLGAQLHDATADADTALAVAEVAPALLGADGARSWFLAVHTPVEQRGGGGFVGNYGEIVSDRGAIRLERLERIRELTANQQGGDLALPPDLDQALARYAGVDITRFFQNALQSPDFSINARAIEALSPQLGGPSVEGVIAIDPLGLAALLEVTGPVSVPLWPVPISAANARRVLLFEQYLTFDDTNERVDFLGDVARAVIAELTSGEVGSPAELARALGPAVAGKHLTFHSARADEQVVLEHLGAAGTLPPVDGSDFFELTTYNTSTSKIDWFLRRELDYDARYDPSSGQAESVVDIRLRNDAPSEGLPAYLIGGAGREDSPEPGENRTLVSFYSVLDLQGATIDGAPIELAKDDEVGRFVYSTLVTIPPGATVTLRLELVGDLLPAPSYRLKVGVQPQATPDLVKVTAAPADGSVATDPPAFEGPLVAELSLRVPFGS